jgi:Uma2 family endonuclease
MTVHITSYLNAVEQLTAGSSVIFDDVPWSEYEQLLDDLGERYPVRVTYDRGRLEIMSPSSKHEKFPDLILLIASNLALELGYGFESFGSTTFRRKSLRQGAEPDTCFYVHNAGSIIGKDEIDLDIDPPPDVVVEVEVTRTIRGKLDLYARLGVPEIWRYDGERLRFYHLIDRSYIEQSSSLAFPILTVDILARFLDQSKTEGQSATLRSFREWVRLHSSSG